MNMERKERLEMVFNYLRHHGLAHTQQDIADKLGKQKANVSKAFNDKGGYLTDNFLKELNAAYGGIFLENWLLKGEGNMIDKEPNEDNAPTKKDFNTSTNAQTSSVSSLPTRPRVPYTVAAGKLTEALEGLTIEQCEKVPVINALPEYDFTIIVKGDSMEPKYEGGDEIACKRIDDTSFIQWGKVHVLDTAQGLILKRIYEDGDKIKCVSYNKDYPDFSIDKREIYSMNLVVGLIRI